jgi:transglutaminase-like putative cysteine protease
LTTEQILAMDKGVCQHFAGLFVAIARQLGIPARQVWGIYISEKSADYHAWVEVELSDGVWWPLEPQFVSDRLPTRQYFPIGVSTEYEVRNGAEMLQAMTTQFSLHAQLANANFTVIGRGT